MRKLWLTLGLTLIGISVAAHADEQAMSVRIFAQHSVIKFGEDLRIDVVTTNNTDHSVVISRGRGRDQAEGDFDIRVTAENGTEIPKTAYYRMIKDGIVEQPPSSTHMASPGVQSSEGAITLTPGGRYVDSFLVGKLYKLGETGTYIVQATRSFPSVGTDTIVSSNKLSITVVEPK